MSNYWKFLFLIISQIAVSQTLLQIESKEITASDFERIYEKNRTSQFSDEILSVDDYLDLYVNFHLKVYEAEEQGIHEEEKFQKEFARYFKQLADNQIANGDVTEEMIQEVYHRMTNEVRVSHILISFPQDSENPKAEAYKKALQLIDSLESGVNFEALAKNHSQDPSVKMNQGDMGWFKVFKMVTPFEDEAYALEVGETSMPVETQFGYHIIKKTGERKSLGKMLVGHIMLYNDNKNEEKNAQKIQEIYERLKSGESFEETAKQFSEDTGSAEKGGVMMPFEIGSLNSQTFENVAFSLTEDNQLSEPFKTRFGWHIIKRLDTEPVAPLDELRSFISKRIKTSDRAKLLNDRIQQNLSLHHKVEVNQEAIEYFTKEATSLLQKSKWEYTPEKNHAEKVAFSIDTVMYSWEDLGNYLLKNQRGIELGQPKQDVVKELANDFLYGKLVEQHKKILTEINPEFKASVDEYRDGLLLYEIMEREVWNKAKNDSLGIASYYETHKNKYFSEKEIEVEIFSTANKKIAKKIRKKLRKGQESEEVAEEFSENAIYSSPSWKKTEASSLPTKLKLIENKPSIYEHNSQFLVVNISSIKEPVQLSLDQVRGRVISDYQEEIEEKWLAELRSKYTVRVDENTLQQISNKFE